MGLLGRVLWGYVAPIQFLIDLGGRFGIDSRAKVVAKWCPNGAQNDPKVKHKTEHEKRKHLGPSWDRVVVALAILWSILESQIIKTTGFNKVSCKITFLTMSSGPQCHVGLSDQSFKPCLS